MIHITYPPHPFKIKEDGSRELIFDEVRRLWVQLTPEEWVRQNFIQYLIQSMQYPASLMAIEKEIRVGELRKRCDIVLYKNSEPWMIVECKEMNVPLSESVAMQVLGYNMTLQAKYLAVTNGSFTYAIETNSQQQLSELPPF